MLADMKSMVMKAWHEHYALLMVGCMSLESAHAATRVAEKNRTPIILSLYQGHLAHFPASVVAAVVKMLAESISVPVTPAFDHDKNPNCTRQAFRADLSGLAIDASAFPLEGNVRQTRVVMELTASAQPYAEGELGHPVDAPCYDQAANVSLTTQPTDMGPFIVQTGIGLLAASVGTAHSVYTSGVIPAIDSQRLVGIFHCSSASLVLYGGSGMPSDQLQLCTMLGVAKVSVGAAAFRQGKSAFLHILCHDISIGLVDTLRAMELVFEEAVTPHLQTGGAIGKA